MRQSELQEDIERFATRFMEAVVEAAAPLSDGDTKTREIALRRILLYTSSALDIATSASPEIGLLDMLVFVSLSRRTLERHWIPTTFGERGQPLRDALVEQENDLWELGGKVLSMDQQLELRNLIDDWLRDNPDRVRVEAIRFSDFSAIAGKLSAKRAAEARGLLGSVKSATVAADDALLLGERAVFMAHRMPFLIRMQARLGASEITTDALHRVDALKTLGDEMPELRPLLTELHTLTHDSKATLVEAQLALRALEPILKQLPPVLAQIPPQAELQTTIGAARLLTEQTGALVGQARTLLPEKPGEILPAVTAAADRTVRRWALYLILIGAAWSIFFWGGYYVFKRLTAEPESGAVVVVQRASSDLKLNPHLHVVFVDGVYTATTEGGLMFRPLPRLSTTDAADVLQIARDRILRHFERRGVIRVGDEALSVDDELTERDPALARARPRCRRADGPTGAPRSACSRAFAELGITNGSCAFWKRHLVASRRP